MRWIWSLSRNLNFSASDLWFLTRKVFGERFCRWEMCFHLNDVAIYRASILVIMQVTSHCKTSRYFVLLCFSLMIKKVLNLAIMQCFSTLIFLCTFGYVFYQHSFWCFLNFSFWSHAWFAYDLWSFNNLQFWSTWSPTSSTSDLHSSLQKLWSKLFRWEFVGENQFRTSLA